MLDFVDIDLHLIEISFGATRVLPFLSVIASVGVGATVGFGVGATVWPVARCNSSLVKNLT